MGALDVLIALEVLNTRHVKGVLLVQPVIKAVMNG